MVDAAQSEFVSANGAVLRLSEVERKDKGCNIPVAEIQYSIYTVASY
jgi:hypothetical protein